MKDSHIPYRIVITGSIDALFVQSAIRDAMKLASEDGSLTFELGRAARTTLHRGEEW